MSFATGRTLRVQTPTHCLHPHNLTPTQVGICCLLTLLLAIGGSSLAGFGLRWSNSSSLPHRLYLSRPFKGTPLLGEYVAFPHPSSRIPLAKKVAGLPGERISLHDGAVYVAGRLIGECRHATSDGTILLPNAEGVIPDGYVFVSGTHPHSFDSRFAEFGLVSIADVKEQLWPVRQGLCYWLRPTAPYLTVISAPFLTIATYKAEKLFSVIQPSVSTENQDLA